MIKRSFRLLIFFVIATAVLAACSSGAKERGASQAGYDFNNPDKFNLPESLFEVSGIAFNEGKSDTVYAVQDEEGKVFRLGWDVPRQLHTKFSKKGDFEDLAIMHGRIYVLKSNGTLYVFPLADTALEETDLVQEVKHLLPDGEYEGMFADARSGELYIICKKCTSGNSEESVPGYILKCTNAGSGSADVRISPAGNFQVSLAPVRALTGKSGRALRPSGLARNPQTGDWYILSAVNKLLVVTDRKWQAKEAIQLNGNIFTQPEGIAFDKSGNLYISNEGDDLFSGNILKFKK